MTTRAGEALGTVFRNPDTNRPIDFLGKTHRRLILSGRVEIPVGYLITPTNRIKSYTNARLTYYKKKNPGFIFDPPTRTFVSPFGVGFDTIQPSTKVSRETRMAKNTYAIRIEGEYILQGRWETKDGDFIRCIRVRGLQNKDKEIQKIIKELEERRTNSSKIIAVGNVHDRIVSLGDCMYDDDFYMSVPMFQKQPPRLLGLEGIDYNVNTGKGMCCIDAIMSRYGGIIPNLTKIKILDSFKKTDYWREVEMTTGHTIAHVQHFCDKYHIKHWVLDLEGHIIHRRLCKSKKYPALVYIFANNHMYLIQDKAVIKSITNSQKETKVFSNATVQRGIAQMEEKRQKMKEYAYEIDTPWDRILDTQPETNIFYTLETLEPIVQYLFQTRNSMVLTGTVKEGNITRVKITDDIFLYANPHIREVMNACEGLGIEFTNQTLESLTFELFAKSVPNHVKSSYSPEIFEVFRNEKTTVFRDTWATPSGNYPVYGVDLRRCYMNILKRVDIVFPLYCPLDEVEVYHGENLEVGFYYIHTSNYMPCKGNGWYREFMLEELTRLGEIFKITHKLIPSRTYERGYFTEFMNELEKGGNVGKQMARRFTGVLGKKNKRKETVKFSTSFDTMIKKCCADSNTDFRPICKGLYRLDTCKEIKMLEDDLPIYLSMINAAMIELNRLVLKVGGKLLKTKTDCVLVENPTWLPSPVDKKYRLETVNEDEIYNVGKVFLCDREYTDVPRKWTYTERNTVLDLGGGFLTNGRPGSGKSWILREMKTLLESKGLTYIVCAPTHAASNNVGGRTFHNIFGMNVDTGKVCEKALNVVKNTDYLLIDECSMLSEQMLSVLVLLKRMKPSMKICLFGDYNQYEPVEVRDTTPKMYEKIRALVSGCKSYDSQKGYTNDLDTDYVYGLLDACKNRSVVSGIEFDWNCDYPKTKPSLDRLDNTRGHCKGNLRFVTEYENWLRGDKGYCRCVFNKVERDYEKCSVLKYLCDGNRLELTEYMRATDMNDILDGDYSRGFGDRRDVDIHLVYTNRKRKELNAICMDRWAGSGKNVLEVAYTGNDTTGRGGQDVKLMVGMPVYAIRTDKKIGIFNSEKFKVSGITDGVSLIGENKTIHVSCEDFMYRFVVGFATTTHKCQGITINEPYAIWEWRVMSTRGRYVAVSRASSYGLINVIGL